MCRERALLCLALPHEMDPNPHLGLTPYTSRVTPPCVSTFPYMACGHGYRHLLRLSYQKRDQRGTVVESKQDSGWRRPRRTRSGTGV